MKKKIISVALALAMGLCAVGCSSGEGTMKEDDGKKSGLETDARELDAFEYSLLNLCGTDAVGRSVLTADGKKSGVKAVGIFYSIWLGQHEIDGIYDAQLLLQTEEGREALYSEDSELSRRDQFHFCSEPLYGYYDMTDPWVVTRHIELLTLAGIDYICIDATNTIIYPYAGRNVLDTLLRFKKQGWNVPKAMFYTNTMSGTTVTRLYNEYYQTEKYDDIWYSPNGKPMIVGITEDNATASDQLFGGNYTDWITPAMKEFFDVAESQWPNGVLNEQGFPWMSWQYPQHIHTGRKTVSVSVAQHSPSRICFSFMDPQSSRGYDYKTGIVHKDYQKGQNFANEWQTVFDNEDDIENVLVTSWNEWMAIKTILPDGSLQMVDVFNEEYSRDVEPMKGSCGDNFYMQLVENVRKFKYTEGKAYKMPKTNISVKDKNSLVLWDFVQARYKDFSGDAMPRDHADAAKQNTYKDNSNRNDITDIRVTHDDKNAYFYVRTADDITEYNGTDKNWMNILISVKGGGFAGFDFIVNRSVTGNVTSVEKSNGGYSWEKVGEGDIAVYGNVMVVSVPLGTLGVDADEPSFGFKVADNVTDYDDITDYYVTGDSAPIGRFAYRYGR